MSCIGSRKWSTSSAWWGALWDFSGACGLESREEYDGGSSLLIVAGVACTGRGDGGEYGGGSRSPCGNDDGVVEIWQNGPENPTMSFLPIFSHIEEGPQ